MKVPTENQIRKRVQFWQKELAFLGIAHWTIIELALVETRDEMPGGSAVASVNVSSLYDSFSIWFNAESISEMDQEEFDCTIVHELVHVAMRDLDAAIDSASEEFHGASVGEWNSRVHHEREGFVDRLSRAIVRAHRA